MIVSHVLALAMIGTATEWSSTIEITALHHAVQLHDRVCHDSVSSAHWRSWYEPVPTVDTAVAHTETVESVGILGAFFRTHRAAVTWLRAARADSQPRWLQIGQDRPHIRGPPEMPADRGRDGSRREGH